MRPLTEEATLRDVVETLAPIERRPGSPGERQAAEWILGRFERAGCSSARIEEEQFLHGYAPLIGSLTGAGTLAGALALSSKRARHTAAALGLLAAAAIADDISNGPRVARRAARDRRPTWNVIAEAGDPAAARTMVVVAHHDAAPTGVIFDDTAQAMFGRIAPGLLERIDTSLPLWWPVLAGPALVALGSLRQRRAITVAGTTISAIATAAFADIARSPTVPGANDNLTGVAVLVALAERLRASPLDGLRVLLVSCGAEEVMQGGITAFGRRHFPHLDAATTFFLMLDTVGSPRLVLVEGEGPVIMEDYPDKRWRDLIARAADEAHASLRRDMRARNSSDSVIPSRAGYGTAMLTSTDRYKALSNYHQMSDTPEHVDYRTVLHALTVADAAARALAADRWLPR
jgi:Zn-dependent M28 family amino/carboxypeptidase